MSTYQMKITADEIAALVEYYKAIEFSDENHERLHYFAKRLIKINRGEPEIEIERNEETTPVANKTNEWN